jgi:hypothetical protein
MRLEMLRESGNDWEKLPLDVKRGTYFHRILVEHENDKGENFVRSIVEECFSHEKLAKIENKVGYLFEGENPILVDKSMNDNGIRGEN